MARLIRHAGTVHRLTDTHITVAMRGEDCSACAHGGACGLTHLAGRPGSVTLVEYPRPEGSFREGQAVTLVLPETQLAVFALFGYLLPVFFLLIGAGLGAGLDGSDGATALGAAAGFVLALVLARLVAGLLPSLSPTPQIVPEPLSATQKSPTFSQEPHHEH